MKYKVYSILHLVILLVYLCRPVMPFIEYALFKDYIAKNLCINRNKPESKCNGKCHLAKQIKLNNETDNSREGNSNKKVQGQYINEFLTALTNLPEIAEKNIYKNNYSQTKETIEIVLAFFVPPEAKIQFNSTSIYQIFS
ncbi:MAG: hypothetical protein U0W24_21905 [Bacteroidales bacterium]